MGLHNDGLAACSCLASLSCFSSAVCASEQHAAIARHNGDVCASIPSLQCLTELSLSICNRDVLLDLGWLSEMQSLRNLLLNMDVQQARFHPSLVTLSSLREMRLIGGPFQFEFDWKAIPALHFLFCNVVEGFTTNLLGLTALQSVREFRIVDEDDAIRDAAPVGKDLIDRLTCYRPEVELWVRFPGLGNTWAERAA